MEANKGVRVYKGKPFSTLTETELLDAIKQVEWLKVHQFHLDIKELMLAHQELIELLEDKARPALGQKD